MSIMSPSTTAGRPGTSAWTGDNKPRVERATKTAMILSIALTFPGSATTKLTPTLQSPTLVTGSTVAGPGSRAHRAQALRRLVRRRDHEHVRRRRPYPVQLKCMITEKVVGGRLQALERCTASPRCQRLRCLRHIRRAAPVAPLRQHTGASCLAHSLAPAPREGVFGS